MAVEFGKWEEIKRNPTIPFTQEKGVLIKGWWSADKEGKNVITNASLEDTVYFHIEMMGASIQDGDKLSLQLYEYDTFIWVDSFNFDDKIENPKECIIKDGKALLEVFLKPDWNKYIEEDTGYEIELYWEVKYNKKNITINLPKEEKYYLRVRNNRNIYIKPVTDKTGRIYGIPEIYAFDGSPMFFAEITNVVDLSNKNEKNQTTDYIEGYVEGYVISESRDILKKTAEKKATKIALAKLEKGYLVTNYNNLTQKSNSVRRYSEYIGDRVVSYYKAPNTGTFIKGETTKGLSQLSAMENHLTSSKTLYFIRDTADIFGSFSSLEDLARGGKDINSVLADALALSVRATPVVGTLLSILGKMTLDILQTPITEFMEEWKESYIIVLNEKKYKGIGFIDQWLKIGERTQVNFPKNYFISYISYKGMQGLLDGSIKNWQQLNEYSKFDEVAILCITKEDYTIIDSFFVNR